ncbi:hypothetical protein [Pseudomonas sp.]|uniref:hypothetical protein n=1 Tax=Pseudomonas sp. TaxID=306 RepID=UPI00272BF993|nr:hypothetical protein [Pseudomonas sp.]
MSDENFLIPPVAELQYETRVRSGSLFLRLVGEVGRISLVAAGRRRIDSDAREKQVHRRIHFIAFCREVGDLGSGLFLGDTGEQWSRHAVLQAAIQGLA